MVQFTEQNDTKPKVQDNRRPIRPKIKVSDCMGKGELQPDWTFAAVIAIHNEDPHKQTENYRPVGLLNEHVCRYLPSTPVQSANFCP